ncbi:MAG TPA: sigma factor-like helix-turn-helix DNA-binding protein [Sphingomicrobium sp.]|nr:sigma factor-like helix-turn-helix DNA-binding protein [Sphingomicrobium sp.]
MTRRRDSDPGVDRAAAVLSPLEREVLVLSAGRHLSIEQIAVRLAISEQRTGRLLAGALVKFDREMHRRPRPWWRFWR